MKYTLEIELGDGNQTLTYEHIRQALQNVRSYLSQYRGRSEVVELSDNAPIRDANGNEAGKWEVTETHSPAINTTALEQLQIGRAHV